MASQEAFSKTASPRIKIEVGTVVRITGRSVTGRTNALSLVGPVTNIMYSGRKVTQVQVRERSYPSTEHGDYPPECVEREDKQPPYFQGQNILIAAEIATVNESEEYVMVEINKEKVKIPFSLIEK